MLTVDDLVYPLFLVDDENIKEEISSLPGNYRLSLDQIKLEIKSAVNLGLQSFMIFPKKTSLLATAIARITITSMPFLNSNLLSPMSL